MTDRDPVTGKWVKGKKGGPGRPPRATEARYLELLKDSVTDQDWIDITKRAVSDAKRGDGAARKWLADYIVGAPVQKHEVDGLNVALIWPEERQDA